MGTAPTSELRTQGGLAVGNRDSASRVCTAHGLLVGVHTETSALLVSYQLVSVLADTVLRHCHACAESP